jgi:effector-binding domain-containing protein
MGETMKKQGAVCRKPAYCFNIYHDGEFKTTDIDVEICEAVEEARPDGDGVLYKKLEPVQKAACLRHMGPYELLGESYGKLFSWLEKEGYTPDGPCRESYIDGIWNREDPEEWITEIQVPVG